MGEAGGGGGGINTPGEKILRNVKMGVGGLGHSLIRIK